MAQRCCHPASSGFAPGLPSMAELIILIPCLLVIGLIAWARRAEQQKQAQRAGREGDKSAKP